jgi:sporulation protein YlmC with PRC-barrel domain
MPEDLQFRIGAEVRSIDGETCGEIRYLVINPDTHKLTELAIEEKGRQGLGRLVRFGDVHVDPDMRAIEFLGTMADFSLLKTADVTQFAPDTVGYELYGPEQVVEEPEYSPEPGEQVTGDSVLGVSYTETLDEVPRGYVEIRRHDPVHSGRHKFGQVQGVLIDPVHHRVTQVLLEVRHLVDRKEVAIPIDDVIEPFGQGGIKLKISKRDVENLPPWNRDRGAPDHVAPPD